ncbi:MAG TPA: hypothetical protein PKK06_11330 [Phycisphaerae bacterium]|nr:hypothetical protein [Phycisphaerae bacterium]HNU45832.1 hypothetical protein [Phycisphaerae bacterium]
MDQLDCLANVEPPDPSQLTELVPGGLWQDFVTWTGTWQFKLLVVLVAAFVLVRLGRRLRRAWRRRRPVTLHPKLQKYAGYAEPDEKLKAQRRAAAGRIVATSSTSSIAGYEIAEQIEAVFVEGFPRPEDALEGLKAAAALKGANAVTNVRHERADSGRYSASGDAVVVCRHEEEQEDPLPQPGAGSSTGVPGPASPGRRPTGSAATPPRSVDPTLEKRMFGPDWPAGDAGTP